MAESLINERGDLVPDAVLQPRDHQAARTLLDAWEAGLGPSARAVLGEMIPHAVLTLRGMLTMMAADLRAAGIAEGYQAGRLEAREDARQVLRDALEDL